MFYQDGFLFSAKFIWLLIKETESQENQALFKDVLPSFM